MNLKALYKKCIFEIRNQLCDKQWSPQQYSTWSSEIQISSVQTHREISAQKRTQKSPHNLTPSTSSASSWRWLLLRGFRFIKSADSTSNCAEERMYFFLYEIQFTLYVYTHRFTLMKYLFLAYLKNYNIRPKLGKDSFCMFW